MATGFSADITVWDISDPENPEKVGQIIDRHATVHNLYIIGDYAFISYYTAGFRVLDVSDPVRFHIVGTSLTQSVIVGEFDTSDMSGDGFNGAFGVYPFAPSGTIYVSDMENGLYIFSFTPLTTDIDAFSPGFPKSFSLYQNYPNPFNPVTTIRYDLPEKSRVILTIYDLLGRKVRKFVNTTQDAGFKSVIWDGTDEFGRNVGTGIYLYQIEARQPTLPAPYGGQTGGIGQAGGFTQTKKMLLLR